MHITCTISRDRDTEATEEACINWAMETLQRWAWSHKAAQTEYIWVYGHAGHFLSLHAENLRDWRPGPCYGTIDLAQTETAVTVNIVTTTEEPNSERTVTTQ